MLDSSNDGNRGVPAICTYDQLNRLTKTYSDSTPKMTYTYEGDAIPWIGPNRSTI